LVSTYIIGGGLTHRWFIDTFCKDDKDEAEKTGINVYEILDKKASRIPPGSESLLFTPHLSGRATPSDTDVRGLYIGFSWTHRKEHFYRAILESIAYESAHSLNIIKANYPYIEFNKVIVLGGGASSNLWNQMKADIIGIPYFRLNRKDTATLGAAIIGGKAVGIFKDMQKTAQEFNKTTDVIQPRSKQHIYYQDYINAYDLLFHNLKEVYRRLKELRELPQP
jgi:xylulokinase